MFVTVRIYINSNLVKFVTEEKLVNYPMFTSLRHSEVQHSATQNTLCWLPAISPAGGAEQIPAEVGLI